MVISVSCTCVFHIKDIEKMLKQLSVKNGHEKHVKGGGKCLAKRAILIRRIRKDTRREPLQQCVQLLGSKDNNRSTAFSLLHWHMWKHHRHAHWPHPSGYWIFQMLLMNFSTDCCRYSKWNMPPLLLGFHLLTLTILYSLKDRCIQGEGGSSGDSDKWCEMRRIWHQQIAHSLERATPVQSGIKSKTKRDRKAKNETKWCYSKRYCISRQLGPSTAANNWYPYYPQNKCQWIS